jgi:hypothetical protein
MRGRDEGAIERRWPGRRGGGRLLPALAVGAVVVVALAVVARTSLLDLPGWFKGGRSDPAPRGDVIYEGQKAKTASEDFLIDVGDGEAFVSVKAKQNHDKSGWLINGDFQSTNGTSSVADPANRDAPAKLRVAVDYCADGTITAEERNGERHVTFALGHLYVCDATLEHTPDNDAAFQQDDTPADFHGKFVSFVAGAAETAAAAAACPTAELDRFRTPEYLAYVRGQLADRFGLPADAIEVEAPTVGASDDDTKAALDERLGSFLDLEDPDHPDTTYEALSVQYLSGDGTAVDDSCYRDPGAKDLDALGDVGLPDPGDR